MATLTPPPQPVTWTLDPPVSLGSASYSTVTLRAPTGADVLKATAVSGEGSMATAMRLISAISAEGMPFEAVMLLPAWQLNQMSRFFESFGGSPMPGPLEAYIAQQIAESMSPAA